MAKKNTAEETSILLKKERRWKDNVSQEGLKVVQQAGGEKIRTPGISRNVTLGKRKG